MFKRALAHQSNATPIRSSDRRKLVKDVLSRYDFLPAEANEDEQRELGRVIMPEGIRSANMQTSGGIDGTLYLSPDNGDPLWMAFGKGSKELIPSLYTFSQPLPRPPLPLIKLHHPVPPPLFTGAPLFIGAVRNLARPWLLPDVAEGDIVAFVSAPAGDTSDEVRYVGVGRMVAKGGMRGAWGRRVEAMRKEEDVDEGRFCDILCIHGDFLWESGSKPDLSTFTMPRPLKPLLPDPSQACTPASAQAPGSAGTEHHDAASALTSSLAATSLVDQPALSTSTPPSAEPPIVQRTSVPLTPSEISTLLSLALLQSLSSLSPSQFPMPASTLYSAHILPNRPAYIPKDQREDVVVGKSEWKKVSKWFKEVGKEGIVKVKESKGEVMVVSFVPTHASIDGHKPFVTIAEDDARAAKRAAKQAAQADSGSSADAAVSAGKARPGEMQVEELWKPTGHGVAFWEACGLDTSALHPVHAMKSALERYITQHNLPDPRNQRMVMLDETLADAVKVRGIDKLSREELLVRLRSGVSWSVSINGVVKKGGMQPITLAIKTRQGRKVVTVITGLETYGIKVDEFAEDLKRICAGSASTQPLQGASPKLNLQEVTVQGNQVKAVTETLVERGVPKRCIKELEGDKRKK